MFWLINRTQCTAFEGCDNSTCYDVPGFSCSSYDCNNTLVLCSSDHIQSKDKPIFYCNNYHLIPGYKFCNNINDCPDQSDEIHDGPGFRCLGNDSTSPCVLPQRNLYDGFAQCKDQSDLCINDSCFRCLDERLVISSKQVCDGKYDCYDQSDEILCELNFKINEFDKSFSNLRSSTLGCSNQDTSFLNKRNPLGLSKNNDYNKLDKTDVDRCQSRKENDIAVILCDGRPECNDLSDECINKCDNLPKFCDYTCHEHHRIGDRYCDGVVDKFYLINNMTNCSEGFDEMHCRKRFKCKSGNKVSIDIHQMCDGKQDCDNNEDEKNCPNNRTYLFI